jgi:glycosyltransferase involved in cell wall biosynthesis
MSELISVIVPIYNVEAFLTQCVDSLIKQNYKNIEIILVDDGSTDNSSQICDEYAKNDNRIISIHKENGGLSSARNAGLDIAKGKYIAFVDSDDFVSADYLESMYNNLKKYNKDISICGSSHYYDKGVIKKIALQDVVLNLNKEEAHKYAYIIGYYDVGMWNKLFKYELFNNIRFPLKKKSEDIFILYKLIDKSNGIYYNSDSKYYYRQRNDSITKSININYDAIEATNNAIDFYKDNKYYDVLLYAYRYLLFAYIGIYNACLCRTNNIKEAKRIRKEAKKIKKFINYKYLSKSRFLQLILFLYCIPIYNVIFKLYFKRQNYY